MTLLFLKVIKDKIKRLLALVPYIKRLQSYESFYPPGHYYNPVPDPVYAKSILYNLANSELKGIDLRITEQFELFQNFYPYILDNPFLNEEKIENHRFYNKNNSYGYGDAEILQALIRHFKPKQIIEVGSGNSSMLMMDVNEKYFGNSIHLTFIDPDPERLRTKCSENDIDRNTIITDSVQNINLAVFTSLQNNDILFIDSSHIVKTGSDLQHILFQVLPVLNQGVYIHFHDIFFGFEYLFSHFDKKGFGWNECYFLRSFLMYNSAFEIAFFSHFIDTVFEKKLRQKYPAHQILTSANIWIQKL